MRSWIWGGALAAATAVGVSWSVAPTRATRPTEVVVDTPVAATAVTCTPADRLPATAVTDVMDLVAELRAGPSTAEPPLAPPRPDAAGEIIPATFLLPADPDEEAPPPREVNEPAPMPREV